MSARWRRRSISGWVGLLAAAWFPGAAHGTLMLNELTIQGPELVELYNGGPAIVDPNGWTIQTETTSWVIAGADVMPPDTYQVVEMPVDTFDDQGGYIELFDDVPIDGMYYGQVGSAPLPPGDGFGGARGAPPTVARAPDGSVYGGAPPSASPGTDGMFWTLDLSPTFGAVNDAPTAALGTSLLMNELDTKPVGGEDTVELFNPLGGGVPLAGWFLCNGDAFQALAGSVPAGGFLRVTTDPGFDLEEDEVVYLFRDDEVRVDQLGLHLPPVLRSMPALDFCQCFARYPDGSAPHDGYDWFSSGGGSTLRRLLCTPEAGNADVTTCTVTSAPGPDPGTWGGTKARYR